MRSLFARIAGFFAAAGLLVFVSMNQSKADSAARHASSQVGEVAWHLVGRGNFNPSGSGQTFGYFTHIATMSGPLFDGAPSEKTAFLTYRSSVFSIQPLPTNGDLGAIVLEPGTFSIYFTSNPNHDWSNPDSFSSGQLV